jgi:hypothetical protein
MGYRQLMSSRHAFGIGVPTVTLLSPGLAWSSACRRRHRIRRNHAANNARSSAAAEAFALRANRAVGPG